jgi:hypothetical protein
MAKRAGLGAAQLVANSTTATAAAAKVLFRQIMLILDTSPFVNKL